MRSVILASILLSISIFGSAQTWSNLGNGMVGCEPTCFSVLEKLYIGTSCVGTATFVGMPIHGICTLEGNEVDTLNSGLGNGYAMSAVWFNGDLIVGGNFPHAGPPPFGVPFTKDIARYDTVTQSWYSMTPTQGVNSSVECMEAYNNDLYIAGSMTSVNGVACNRIAKWNGTAWSDVSGGVSGWLERIECMTIYHGELYVGGIFLQAGTGNIPTYYIARWNGTQWDSVGSGLNGAPYAMVVDTVNDLLYVGGAFTMAGGTQAFGVAVWNDTTWAPVGTGADTLWGTRCMALMNGELYAGGGNVTITTLGDTIKNVYKYNGTKWISVDGGAGNSVLTMTEYNGNIYIGGAFSQVGYGIPANRIACYGTSCPTSVRIDEQPPPVPFSMYPNPNDDVLHITTQDPSELMFRLYNSAGQLVKEEKFTRQFIYSTKDLAAGSYTVQVSLKDGSRPHNESLIIR